MWKTYMHWIENKHGASKIIDTFATYQKVLPMLTNIPHQEVDALANVDNENS